MNKIRNCLLVFPLLAVLAGASAISCHASPSPTTPYTLKSKQVEFAVVPAFGGRVTHFSLPQHPNILKVLEPITPLANTDISVATPHADILGGVVWLGPQSEWWSHQTLDPARAKRAASWPPDPYTVLTNSALSSVGPAQIALRGVASPVTGMRVDRRFELLPTAPDTVLLEATATNIAQKKLSWDLWFNNRVGLDTQVFVPVRQPEDVRVEQHSPADNGTVGFQWADGIAQLQWESPKDGVRNSGKLFIRPAEGWLAALRGKQLFVISFDLLPAEQIHSQQAQVELYVDARKQKDEGLIELEFHGAYTTTAPGEQMTLRQKWQIAVFDGASTALQKRLAGLISH